VVYVLDWGNQRIQKFSADGVFLGKWSSTRVGYPPAHSIAMAGDGGVLVLAESFLFQYDADGNYLFRLPLTPSIYPNGTQFATDVHGNIYWTTLRRGGAICTDKYSPSLVPILYSFFCTGSYSGQGGVAGDAAGTFFVPTLNAQNVPVIVRRAPSGEQTSWPGSASKLALDGLGHLFGSAPASHQIHVWDETGNAITSFGTFGTGPGQFNRPTDVDATPAGRIYVVDRENDRIQVFGTAVVPARATSWGRMKAGYR
jgi:sugar lactone lactonase YvrE